MDYKISVIIPVYNAEETLKTAIESVINQSIGFDNIELIIVNDNSRDNSKKVIDSYSEKYENINGIHLEKNSGFPGKPRNIGIDNAHAPYLVFLDADDEYLPNAFEIYYNTITKEKSDFVMSTHYWNLENDKVKVNILHESDEDYDLINFDPLLNEENFRKTTYYHVSPWGKIFDKNVIMKNNIRFLEDSLSEDAYFYYKTLINSKKITFLPNDALYIYNIADSNDSIIHSHNLKTFDAFLKGFEEVLKLLEDVPFKKTHPIRASVQSLILLFSNLTIKEKKENIHRVYELESTINEEIYLPLREVKLLNDEILKQHYTRAIILSEIYSKLYNNNFIRKFYRKFRYRLVCFHI